MATEPNGAKIGSFSEARRAGRKLAGGVSRRYGATGVRPSGATKSRFSQGIPTAPAGANPLIELVRRLTPPANFRRPFGPLRCFSNSSNCLLILAPFGSDSLAKRDVIKARSGVSSPDAPHRKILGRW